MIENHGKTGRWTTALLTSLVIMFVLTITFLALTRRYLVIVDPDTAQLIRQTTNPRILVVGEITDKLDVWPAGVWRAQAREACLLIEFADPAEADRFYEHLCKQRPGADK